MNDSSPTQPSSPTQQIAPPSGFALCPRQGLLLGLLSAAIVFAIVQATYPIFRMSEKVNVAMGRPTAEFLAVIRQNDRNEQKHAALYLGCLGALTAGALSLRESLARRTWLAPILALPLGALGGAVGGWLGCLVLEHARDTIGQLELKHLVEAQLAAGLPLGLGIGLGFGVATRSLANFAKSAATGLAAGAVAGTAYAVIVSILLPTSGTDALLPVEASTRLLWLCTLAGLIGLIIPVAGKQKTTTTVPLTGPAT